MIASWGKSTAWMVTIPSHFSRSAMMPSSGRSQYRGTVQNALFDGATRALEDIVDGIVPLVLPGDFQTFLERVGLVGSHDVAEIAFVEMNVAVDIARRDQPTRGVDLLAARGLDTSRDLGDAAIGYSDVPGPFHIRQACVPDDHIHGLASHTSNCRSSPR